MRDLPMRNGSKRVKTGGEVRIRQDEVEIWIRTGLEHAVGTCFFAGTNSIYSLILFTHMSLVTTFCFLVFS